MTSWRYPGEQYGASDALRPKPGQVVVQERDAVDGRHWLGPVVGERPEALATASREHQCSRYRRPSGARTRARV